MSDRAKSDDGISLQRHQAVKWKSPEMEVVMFDLERFLTFARDRLAETDEALPCEPEDCAAIMSYLCALVPECNLACQVEADSDVERRADRKRALVDGFRRARGAAPVRDDTTTRSFSHDDLQRVRFLQSRQSLGCLKLLRLNVTVFGPIQG
jgi:hypothetical protein